METNPPKQRFSNIELCRIISILLVILIHSQFYALGQPKELNSCSVVTLFLEACGIIGVDVFIMISGYFSIHLKFRSVLNLLYICLFCSIVTNTAAFFTDNFKAENLLFLSRSSWFVLDYIGLLLLSPILNAFVENSNRQQFRFLLILLLVYQTWFGWNPGYNQGDFNHGYSILTFCILYLLMRYVRIYDVRLTFWQSFALYVLCTVSITLLHAVSMLMKSDFHQYEYCNPLVILSAFAFFNMFLALKMNYVRSINRGAKSTLTILLLHNSSGVWPFLRDFFKEIHTEALPLYFLYLLSAILCIGGCCLLVDQVRIVTYQRLEQWLYVHPFIRYVDRQTGKLLHSGKNF